MSLIVDGAMGTTLQQLYGLSEGVVASPWSLSHPDAVLAVHRAFREAGAAILCTNTLCSSPELTPHWREELVAGVRLARQGADGALVWLALGPGQHQEEAVSFVASRIDGVLLETFLDPVAGLRAAAAIRAVWKGPLVLSIVPDEEGNPRGVVPGDLLREAQQRELTGLGLNCMPTDAISRGLDRLQGELPLWAKPSHPSATDLESLTDRAHWLGGCCGTPPSVIAALRAEAG